MTADFTTPHAPASVLATLVVSAQHGLPGFEVPLYAGANELGREVMRDHDFVSMRHCSVDYRHRRWWLHDHGSTNGTFLDGDEDGLIPECRYQLLDGDGFSVGRVRVRLAVVDGGGDGRRERELKRDDDALKALNDDDDGTADSELDIGGETCRSPSFPAGKRVSDVGITDGGGDNKENKTSLEYTYSAKDITVPLTDSTSTIKNGDADASSLPQPPAPAPPKSTRSRRQSAETSIKEEKSEPGEKKAAPAKKKKPSADSSDATTMAGKKRSSTGTTAKSSSKTSTPSKLSFDTTKMVVLSTGLSAAANKKAQEVFDQYGIGVALTWEQATHVLTEKVKRTAKLLSGLASGRPLISFEWINKCKRAKKLQDPAQFPLVDEDAEQKWSFSLEESKQRVATNGASTVLQRYSIMATPSVGLDLPEMRQIVEACGGKLIYELPSKLEPNIIVVGHEDDCELLVSYRDFGWEHIVGEEFLYMTALTQEVDFEKYALSLGKGSKKRRHR